MYPNQGQPNPYGGGYNQFQGSAPPFGAGSPPFGAGEQQPFGAGGQPPFGAGGQPPFGAGGQPPFGAGGQPPFGAGYPMPQPQMQMPGMPQPFNYQSPPMNTQPGYPQQPMGQGVYPSQQSMPPAGFPSQQSMPPAGFPPQQSMPPAGFPPQQSMPPAGFSPQQSMPPAGFPPQQSMPPAGFPPQQQSFQAYPQANQPSYPQMPQGNFGMAPDPMMQQQQYSNQSYGASQPQQVNGSPGYAQQMPTKQKGRPCLVPAPNFNASNDAAALRKAMKGFGTNEDAIIEVLCRRSNAQRVDIVRAYKTAYGKDLPDDIRSETTGNFENVLIALLSSTSELYARELYEAMYGEGTDENVLIEVMCTMSNYEIRSICAMFQRMFGKSLEQELRSDTSGTFKRLMTSLSTANRDESMVTDVNSARIDAQELKKAGIDKWGTDESVFNRILCLRNYEQIKLIALEYEKLTGHTLEKDIKREFSGDIEDGLLSILRVAHNRPEFFARRLHKSMAGIGTNDKSLIRLVVTRCEIDMVDIKEEFQRYYGKSLKSFIKGDTSGDYKHALYALCGENRS